MGSGTDVAMRRRITPDAAVTHVWWLLDISKRTYNKATARTCSGPSPYNPLSAGEPLAYSTDTGAGHGAVQRQW
jgi:hypothetical protein